ncbi:major facilitator superfamily domain-containing protein [Gaertneriomyces semiglobifer]|nr:major facilitator superfamily domain-containing protein [Gaertneriomyces semiglobifer]
MSEGRLSFFQLMALTLPWIGVQAIWSAEFGVVTPVMLEYGLNDFWATNIWIFGPLTGFFTAPIIGAISDGYDSRYGRRKPFIVGGLLTTLVASLVFAFSEKYSGRLPVAFISFIILDITINVMQTPLRALAGDNAAEDQQTTVQMLATFFQGVGNMVGFGLSKRFWKGKAANMPPLITIVMGINILFIALACFLVKERPNKRRAKISITQPFTSVFKSIASMDFKMAVICAVEFFTWAAAFAYWPAASSWWPYNVYKGCPADDGCTPEQDALYEEGSAKYGDASLYQAIAQTFFGIFLAVILARGYLRRVRIVYFLALALGAVLFILAKFGPDTVGMAYAVTILFGSITNCAYNSFPFALVGRYSAEDNSEDAGVKMGLLNVFICTPQFIMTFIVSALRNKYGILTGLPWAFFIAGVCMGIAAILTLLIREGLPVKKAADADYEVAKIKS